MRNDAGCIVCATYVLLHIDHGSSEGNGPILLLGGSVRKASLTVHRLRQPSKIIVIGLGNPYRSDDAAGLIVARRLKQQCISFCEVHELVGDGTALMELWKGAQRVVVIDAVQSGAAPGTIHRFEANLHPLPAPMFHDSTHAFGLMDAVELSRALNQLPSSLVIYGIEGKNFEAGTGASQAVLDGLNDLVRELRQEIDPSAAGAD